MSTFLENVAKYLYKHHKDDLGDCVVVFPGRRAAVFFRKFLAAMADSTFWSPKLLTVGDFYRKLSDIVVIDDLKLLFELFTIYKKETGSDETFDQFYFWGSMLLGDFDDVDKYLVNAGQLFKNIESLKDIEERFTSLQSEELEIIKQFWINFNPTKTSFHKDGFIKIWKVLFKVYSDFREVLKKDNFGYEGMVFRDVAEKVDENGFLEIPWKKIFFVGLNALTPSEKKVMNALQRTGKAEFFWDYDEFYLDPFHEAGMFMRENIKQFPAPEFGNSFNNIRDIPKSINVLSVSSNIGQAKNIYRSHLKNNEGNNGERIESCIVLADESLLVPVLYSIPEEIVKINVTMGYPLTASPVFHFIKLLIDLQQSSKKNGRTLFYYQPVLSLLSHQYLTFWDDDVLELKTYILENNKVYIPEENLKKNEFFRSVFSGSKNEKNFAQYLLEILVVIMDRMLKTSKIKYYDIEKEFIYRAFLVIKRLDDILSELKLKVEMPTLHKMMKKALQSGKVDFIGEPLSGLQVMGALETRGIDFKNLVITSMNEGMFPKKTTAQSFVPYNLRRAFGMPTYEHQDAIYAYYFYRLLQRAENITLIYNSNSEGVIGGEMSRYIYQLIYDSPLKVNMENIEYKIKGSEAISISIKSNEFTKSSLQRYIDESGESYLSPSAVNYLKNCSLRFYYRYIAGLKEADEVVEDMDYALFGSVLHCALEQIYGNFVGKEVQADWLDEILKDGQIIEKAIDEAFVKEYMHDSDGKGKMEYTGRNTIIKEVIGKYIIRLIEVDREMAPFTIIKLEGMYCMSVPIYNGKIKIKMGGKIDRVDFMDGVYRIIDYKTGIRKNTFKSIEELFSPEKKGEGDAVLQVFLYSLLFEDNISDNLPIRPSLAFLREIYKDDFSMNIEHAIAPRKKETVDSFLDYKEELIVHLKQLLEKLFSDNFVFDQTDDQEYCKTCAYKEICHR